MYHKNKTGDYTALGGKNYKTGKAFHIYRPKITDKNGRWIWGELHIDEKKGELSVTVNQSFLDNAVYPVTVDPTFGDTSCGATAYNDITDVTVGSWFTSTGGGTTDRLLYQLSVV